MQLDGTINIPTLVAILGMAVTVIVWLTRMEAKVNSATEAVAALGHRVDHLADEIEKTEKSFDQKIEKVESSFVLRLEGIRGLIDITRDGFAESKIQMAKEYATNSAVAQIKTEIVGELQKTEARIDANISRLVAQRERVP
jgi:hypothetical protein